MSGYRLAIDTSTPLGSVAVGRAGEPPASEIAVGVRARHSESLLPAIDRALEAVGVGPDALEAVVVGGGPGSFTGVRITGATAKGLVAALDVPLYAYSGLLALAAGLGAESRPVCALFDARRGEVYAGCYRFPGYARIETVLEPAARPIEEVLEAVAGTADGSAGTDGPAESVGAAGAVESAAGAIFAGGGARRYRETVEAAGGEVAPSHLAAPRAAALLWLAELDPEAGRVAEPAAWEPAYMRASGAERRKRG